MKPKGETDELLLKKIKSEVSLRQNNYFTNEESKLKTNEPRVIKKSKFSIN